MLEFIILANLTTISVVLLVIAIVLGGVVYFLPSLWAIEVHKNNKPYILVIFVLNALLGVVIPVWIILLLWGSGKIWKD